MAKNTHEIRDPIHVFIKLDSQERQVLDSPPFQRLRCIHQLAMTYLVYPGATHRRFEHSLGVMELAGRVYDVLTNPENLTDDIRHLFPQTQNEDERRYWRRVLRIAALCHDIGHLPFSHAAEELMPKGWDHEKMTREIILSSTMQEICSDMRPKPEAKDIVKLAIGPKKALDLKFNDWEILLAEIIVGNAFGVDRMDYLLRDSLHTGVAYGRFDHFRLIDTMRILPPPEHGDEQERSSEPCIGVEAGGLQSAESLLLARYFMFSQVYFHPIRRIYDIHLKDFLSEWLEGGCYPTDTEQFFAFTDAEIISAMRQAAKDAQQPGHIHAERIINRNHFRRLYEGMLSDIVAFGGTMKARQIATAASNEFGGDKIRFDSYPPKDSTLDFPVLERDKSVVSAHSKSQVLKQIPVAAFDYVFVDKEILPKAEKWYENNKDELLVEREEEE
ncbi:MAG: HD domain-containing protein [Proteobacteria bacterium]|nr:HD domain-containing protein [Pseudomonadota bacterium]